MSPLHFFIAENLVALSGKLDLAAWKAMVNRTIATLCTSNGFRPETFRNYLQQRVLVIYLLASCEPNDGAA